MLPQDVAKGLARAIERIDETGKVQRFDYVLKIAGKDSWFSANVNAVRDRTGKTNSYIGVVRNITERKRAEKALYQYAAELEARNEELDAFAHTVAHDLKTPLGLILGYAEMLAQDYAVVSGEELQKHLQTVAGTAFRMNNIINELLLLSELREREVETGSLNMARIVADAQQRLTGMIGEHQAEIVLPEAWPAALGHGPWVEAVWANCISNGNYSAIARTRFMPGA